MAKQKGLVQFEGTFEGINFYFRKGKPFARRSGGGFNGKAIKTKASMVRVRENGSEFGSASRAKKLFRLSIREALLSSKDGDLHGRMMTLMQEIKVADLISERGKRTVWNGLKTTLGKKLFTDFLFTPKQRLLPLFNCLPVVSDLGAICDFSGVQFDESSFRKSATDVGLTYFVADYCLETLEFTRYSSEQITLSKAELPVIIPPFEITGLPPNFEFRMAFLAVQFYQKSNEKLVDLKEEGMTGLRCISVFEV